MRTRAAAVAALAVATLLGVPAAGAQEAAGEHCARQEALAVPYSRVVVARLEIEL